MLAHDQAHARRTKAWSHTSLQVYSHMRTSRMRMLHLLDVVHSCKCCNTTCTYLGLGNQHTSIPITIPIWCSINSDRFPTAQNQLIADHTGQWFFLYIYSRELHNWLLTGMMSNELLAEFLPNRACPHGSRCGQLISLAPVRKAMVAVAATANSICSMFIHMVCSDKQAPTNTISTFGATKKKNY